MKKVADWRSEEAVAIMTTIANPIAQNTRNNTPARIAGNYARSQLNEPKLTIKENIM